MQKLETEESFVEAKENKQGEKIKFFNMEPKMIGKNFLIQKY